MREIYCNQRDEDEVAVSKCLVPVFSRNTGIIVKNVHATIPKGNMGYDQYTVPHTVAVAPTFVAFLSSSTRKYKSMASRAIFSNFLVEQ